MILGITWRSLPVSQADNFTLHGSTLADAVQDDTSKGLIPIFVVGTVGSTNTGAVDDIEGLGEIGMQTFIRFNIVSPLSGFFWLRSAEKIPTLTLYVDAAWAGMALVCPEYRAELQLAAINKYADAFSTNFHKWGGKCSLPSGIDVIG